jgi:Polyketide cyclase / dehydrase and lipid transport
MDSKEVIMLNTLTIVAVVPAVAIAATLAYAATRPDTFRIQRSASIKALPENIFPMINDLRTFNTWNPFLKLDPATKLTYSGPASGNGAAHAWEGNSQVGKGRVEITDATPSSKIAIKLDIMKPMQAQNQVEFTLVPQGDATTVTWMMQGGQPLLAKVMSIFIDCDKMVGAAFEQGLADLKTLAEK